MGRAALLLLLLLPACRPAVDDAYRAEIEAYHQHRLDRLRDPDGWLTLTGLFWLADGEQPFGTDSASAVVFPGEAPARIGTFVVRDSTVTMRVEPGVAVMHEGEPVEEIEMRDDVEGEPTVVRLGPMSWHVIRRSAGLGIRLRDTRSPVYTDFEGIETFPVDPRWRLTARFEPYDPPRTIPVPNILGTVDAENSPGALVFEVDGESYRLDVTGQPGDARYFVVFADGTSGQETYGGGRFLYVDAPGPDNRVVVDFNKAYNPPCVFTPYATCPLPPSQNRLAVRIEAGEKTFGEH